ncbi:MAG: hypothetical protein ACLGSD_10300 [Acidobacteriota bacterium]
MSTDTGLRQLTSWKEIADYLRVSVRTAQSWEHERGLPVERMPGEKGRVLATAQDLDRWQQSLRKTAWWSSPAHLKIIALSFAILFFSLLGYEIARHVRQYVGRQADSYRLGRRSLTVLDANGKDMWRVPFAEPFESADYADAQLAAHRKISFDDIDGDGDVETLFVYSPLDSLRNPSALYCFSREGKERWTFAPARMSRAEGQGYGRIDVLNDMLVTQPNGKSESYILLLDCRQPGHSAKLFVLSPRGESLATFTHQGHLGMLEAVDVDGCGRKEVLVGGSAGERNEAELIVLEMPHDFGPAKQSDLARNGTPPLIKEKAVLMFPRTCVNRKLEQSNRIAHIAHSGDTLTVVVSELSDDPSVEVTYQLDRHFQVKNVWFSDALKNLHSNLTAEGILDHSLTEDEVNGLGALIRTKLIP